MNAVKEFFPETFTNWNVVILYYDPALIYKIYFSEGNNSAIRKWACTNFEAMF